MKIKPIEKTVKCFRGEPACVELKFHGIAPYKPGDTIKLLHGMSEIDFRVNEVQNVVDIGYPEVTIVVATEIPISWWRRVLYWLRRKVTSFKLWAHRRFSKHRG